MADSSAQTASPVTEKGYVLENGLTDFMLWDRDERVPELIWPNSVDVFKRMTAEDGRISSVIEAITLPILRTQWRIDPAGAPAEVVEFIARNFGLPVVGVDANVPVTRTRGRFLWIEHLEQALSTLDFGHAFFEQVYRVDPAGRYELRKLAPRPQDTIANINVARDGGLVSIEQFPAGTSVSGGAGAATIPVDRLVAYVRKPRPGQWYGRSLLRPAYKHWLAKDELMRIEIATARRNGMGVPVATSSEQERSDDAAIKKYQKLASQYRGGVNSGVGLPYGAKLELLGVEGNLPNLRQAIEYHDKQMALAGLAHFLNLDKGGSYSLASVLNDTFVQSVQTIAESIRATAQAHALEDLVDVNWGPDTPAPRLVFDEIGSRQDATAAALQLLVNAGILTPDERLEAFERQQLGLPAADPDTDTQPSPDDSAAPGENNDGEAEPAVPPAARRSRRTSSSRRRQAITIETDGALTLW
ncbi:portal protein [Gordonia phage Kiko]|nr:portal protein [Gordonia phage Kiko]